MKPIAAAVRPGLPASAALLLSAGVVIAAVGLVLSPALFSPGILLAYGLALLAVIALVNASHLVCSWLVFFGNPVLRAQWGRAFLARFLLLPLLYMALVVWITVEAHASFPLLQYLPFLLIFDGPVFAYHVASQDKGFLAVLSGKRGSFFSWVVRFYYPVMLAVLVLAFSRSLYNDQSVVGLLGERAPAWRSALDLALIVAAAAGVLTSAFAAWRLAARGEGDRATYAYLASLAVWCLALLCLLHRSGLPLVLLLIHSVRHAGMYLLLAREYFLRGNQRAPVFWLRALVPALPLGAALFFVYAGLPGFWSLVQNEVAGPLQARLYPFLLGSVAALLLYHYDIERYSWRFSDPEIGAHLRARVFPPESA